MIEPLWSERLLEELGAHGGPDMAGAVGTRHWPAADKRGADRRLSPRPRIAPRPRARGRAVVADAGDIHVLATAIAGQANAVITLNLKDFPPRRAGPPHGLEAIHPRCHAL